MASEALQNLQRIGLLDAVPFSAELQARMLRTAQSRLQDAVREGNSLETRFDCEMPTFRSCRWCGALHPKPFACARPTRPALRCWPLRKAEFFWCRVAPTAL
jgi:hypothetical protein